ncbi:MurR/RpiR family transcriptional regulator [Clostridium sp. Marseille-P3244]|uniref:MurR/RpiR family transcriptional regulator n=1 Tax=Clostridium sp. Marseille-P3244 TaxID=1871020 RepID=UPI00093148AE|nr:MurR/RpiR family transcriptional regulator [Clostridium sp. Marseille-P3244]
MDNENQVNKQIKAGYADLRRSEKLAADYILEHTDQVPELSIDRLAGNAGVSQPTVLRMLKSLGFSGYRDFRYQLVAELAKAETKQPRDRDDQLMYGYTLNPNGRLEDIPANMASTASLMIEETLKNLPGKIYKKAIETLKNARMIDIYSVENSEVTAADLLTKLLYLGLPCRHFSDCYLQRISAGSLGEGDVAVGISYSGESKDTVDAMRTAKRAGAVTIVITNFRDSTIGKYADILICTSQDQYFYGDAIFSRMTQLLIVDMLYMGIIASDYDHYASRLKKCEKVVREKAYEDIKKP